MIYLDCNATTALDDVVIKTMTAHAKNPSNPSSVHYFGRKAKELLLNAQAFFASSLGVKADEIIFTSGGTESLNSLIRGLYDNKGTVLTTDLEHPCILETLSQIKAKTIYLSPKYAGAPDPSEIEKALTDNISLMIFSAVYSETGVMTDLNAIAKLAYDKQIPLIIDAVAILGKQPFKILPGMTGVGFSAHKLHGPQGVGAMYLHDKASFKPLLVGGGQQMAKRAGTENILGIVGFHKAYEIALNAMPKSYEHMKALQDLFISELKENMVEFKINGDGPKVCNTLNIAFEPISGETLLINLDQNKVAASLGSACSSGSLEPSKVLLNMGYEIDRVKKSLRFSWSRHTKQEELQLAAKLIAAIISASK